MQALHDAILEALFSGGVLPPELLDRLLGDPADADQEQARQQLEELIQQIIDRMKESGYITASPDLESERHLRATQHLKHVELANVCCTDLRHLRRELHGAVKRLRQKPHIIRGCIRHAGYHL